MESHQSGLRTQRRVREKQKDDFAQKMEEIKKGRREAKNRNMTDMLQIINGGIR